MRDIRIVQRIVMKDTCGLRKNNKLLAIVKAARASARWKILIGKLRFRNARTTGNEF